MSAARFDGHPPVFFGARPVLGLLVGGTPPGLRDLLVALYPRCDPRHVPGGESGAGRLDPIALLVAGYPEPVATAKPYALWLSSTLEAETSFARAASVLLSHDPTLAESVDGSVEVVPWSSQPAGTPVAPAVRARIRIARGLAPAPIATYENGAWHWLVDGASVPSDQADSLCALAAAVVATSPAEAVRAMSWAAPTVLDRATAGAVRATDGADCVVADTGAERLAAARDLAADAHRAARLSRGARELVTARHDLAALARRVGDRLGLPVAGDGPSALLAAAIDGLGAGRRAPIRTRAAAALDGYPLRPHGHQSVA